MPANREIPIDAEAETVATGEKVYCAVVIICAGLLLASAAMFHLFIIPGTEEPGIFYFLAALIWLEFFALAITVGLNLYYRSLLVIPTVVQCAVLALSVYLIPIAIWGGVLLYQKLQRERTDRQ
jgi:hypothetical protein